MSINVTSLSHLLLSVKENPQQIVSYHQGAFINKVQFYNDVQQQIAWFKQTSLGCFALYYEQAYPFSVSLFALLHAQKKIWIAANNKSVVAEQLTEKGCCLLGDWQGKETQLNRTESEFSVLCPLDLSDAKVTVFTSGSSGQPKEITKNVQQFQTEIETLESYWGRLLGDSQILSTVSHQHIYGLLFRVLWPLAANRCFHSDMYLSPEPLFNQSKGKRSCWVASPAQLKRLDDLTEWAALKKMAVIFSSGGELPVAVAQKIDQNCDHHVLEIYGSSETGGIAWRQSVNDPLWQVFDRVKISVKQETCELTSPYLAPQEIYRLDDKIKIIADGRFSLLGRKDRIVKIEEKRLSLDQLENKLCHSNLVKKAHALLLLGRRDKIAVTLVLTEWGEKTLNSRGRPQLIKLLKKLLMTAFETVVLPRKWLFISALPVTPESKVNQGLLTQLFDLQRTHSPQIVYCDYQGNHLELQLKIQPDLVYFTGHFPVHPVLPGVTQIAWVEQFAQLFFDIQLPFLRMEVIKFKKIIQPNDLIKMTLNWKEGTSKLYFELTSIENTHSSGRIVYGEQP